MDWSYYHKDQTQIHAIRRHARAFEELGHVFSFAVCKLFQALFSDQPYLLPSWVLALFLILLLCADNKAKKMVFTLYWTKQRTLYIQTKQ